MKKIALSTLVCLFFTLFTAHAASDPWSQSKFRPVLQDSKLQAPTSSPAAVSRGNFPGFSASYFKLVQDRYMQFEMTGKGKRSELRQEVEWKTSSSSSKKIIGNLKIFNPSTSSLNQFTFMQIHDSGSSPNKPLVRLVWLRNRNGIQDHLWCIRRTSVNNNTYEYTNLGPRPGGFFKCEILVVNNQLRVKINDTTKVNKNVSYWANLNSYYKAGVYLQDEGTAKVQFDTLRYYY